MHTAHYEIPKAREPRKVMWLVPYTAPDGETWDISVWGYDAGDALWNAEAFCRIRGGTIEKTAKRAN